MSLIVAAPVTGTVVDLSQVADPVFAQGILGPGLAVLPEATGPVDAVAPFTGTVDKIHPHAVVLVDVSGRAVLVHLGIDTVALAGRGFTVRAAEGQRVEAGQALITWDPARLAAEGINTVVPVVALEAQASDLAPRPAGERVSRGERLLTWD